VRPGATVALLALMLAACASTGGGEKPGESAPAPLASILARPALMKTVARADELRLQIVLGLIEDGPDGKPVLRQVSFRAGAEYFYPASSVKLFAAVAALEKLHALRKETGLAIDLDTPLVYHPLFEDEVLESADPSNLEGGKITLRHELRKLFLVSDNKAFNRCYEMVGQDQLAASLSHAGISNARIVHRLAESHSAVENRRSPRIDFVGKDFSYTLPEREAAEMPPPPPLPGLLVGKGYLAAREEVPGPMDFSGKNRIPLMELQRGLCKILRPDIDCGPGAGFAIDDADRALLTEVMAEYPRESKNPVYDVAEYPDDYGKFLLPGLRRKLAAGDVRVSNKFGQAYGFSTENALVHNAASGKTLFLAATIYTNSNGILNDDEYDYVQVARPFYAALGEALAELLK